jgi:hypothetical protein
VIRLDTFEDILNYSIRMECEEIDFKELVEEIRKATIVYGS